jgi:multicomponent Na+:H+ antiporter subunit G
MTVLGFVAAGVAGALLLLGTFGCVTAAVGVVRFPDAYTRLHAAGVGDTLGAGAILLGLAVWTVLGEAGVVPELVAGRPEAAWTRLLVATKLGFILAFLWSTGTTACHALAKSAWLAGLVPWTRGGGPSKP